MAIKLSHGNKKLVSTKDVKFLIWSIPPQTTCPYATEHCKASCYAMKAWKAYPNVRKAWTENYNETLKHKTDDNFVSNMVNAITAELNRPSFKRAKEIIVRIHESGDFYSQAYANAWRLIASRFMEDERIHFMAYTKSVSYFMDGRTPSNMTVRFSLWDDTKPSQTAMATKLGLPVYTAVDEFTNEPESERCGCDDCGSCGKCWSLAYNMLKCEIH